MAAHSERRAGQRWRCTDTDGKVTEATLSHRYEPVPVPQPPADATPTRRKLEELVDAIGDLPTTALATSGLRPADATLETIQAKALCPLETCSTCGRDRAILPVGSTLIDVPDSECWRTADNRSGQCRGQLPAAPLVSGDGDAGLDADVREILGRRGLPDSLFPVGLNDRISSAVREALARGRELGASDAEVIARDKADAHAKSYGTGFASTKALNDVADAIAYSAKESP